MQYLIANRDAPSCCTATGCLVCYRDESQAQCGQFWNSILVWLRQMLYTCTCSQSQEICILKVWKLVRYCEYHRNEYRIKKINQKKSNCPAALLQADFHNKQQQNTVIICQLTILRKEWSQGIKMYSHGIPSTQSKLYRGNVTVQGSLYFKTTLEP